MVFRPADRPFPPARGRTSFELRPDGTYVETSPGPVDVPEDVHGLVVARRMTSCPDLEGRRCPTTLEITGAEADRLTVRK